MSDSLLNSPAVMAFVAIPSEVRWSYFVFGVIIAIGLVTIVVRGDWQKARGFDKLILFGPLFYAAPIAAFGTEHFTVTNPLRRSYRRGFRGISFGHTSWALAL